MKHGEAHAKAGAAGEHLVCADLFLSGLSASLAPAGSPYDILVETAEEILRVQVKSVFGKRTKNRHNQPKYHFDLRCRVQGTRRQKNTKAVDLFALVSLDRMKIAYIRPDTISKPTIALSSEDFDTNSFVRAYYGHRHPKPST